MANITINVTVKAVPHPNPQQVINLFARLGLELYEKEIGQQEQQNYKPA